MIHADQSVQFAAIATGGYYLALRVGFAFPMAEHNAFPEAWVDEYTRDGLLLDDPAMRWAYQHIGVARWSALNIGDPRGVLNRAASHGLHYGAAISIPGDADGPRSLGLFSRTDREFSDPELTFMHRVLQHSHDVTVPKSTLTDAELEALRMVRDGMLMKEIANRLGVSEGAIKQRLRNARVKLRARTGSHAVSIAVGTRLI